MVVHIRLMTEEQLADEREAQRFRELWAANEQECPPPPWRSLPIKVWALLHEGPLTLAEMAEKLQVKEASIQRAIAELRDRGQDIFCPHTRYNHRSPRKYYLVPREPLQVVQSTVGLSLVPRNGKLKRNQVIIELK